MIIFKNRIQKLRINLFTVIVYISYFVFAPILLDFIELNINIVWQKLLSLVLVIGINIKCYFDYTQNTILIINDFLDVLNFMNSNPNFIVENKKDISVLKETFNRIKWYQWGLLVLTILFVYILSFISLEVIKYFKFGIENFNELDLKIRLLIILFVGLIFWKIDRNKKSKSSNMKLGVLIEGIELIRYEDIIKKYCQEVKIENIVIKIEERSEINAYAITRKWDIPIIIFSTGMMRHLESLFNSHDEKTMDNIFQLLFCHELIHVLKNDNIKIEKRAAYSVFFTIVFFTLLWILIIHIPVVEIIELLSIPVFLFQLIAMIIISDKRYWGQMSEFRADKISIKLTGISPEYFEIFFDSINKSEQEQEFSSKIDDSNIFYKYYKREVEIEYHPNIEERIKVLKDDTPWGIIYYIKHAITIIKWRLNKKGWNGR